VTRVSLIDLGKTWPGMARPALDGLSLDIAEGELVALLGPSGCGKTTALRIIAGLIQPNSGDLHFDGRPVLGLPPERRGAVLVFQNHLLFPHMSVAENVGFGLRMRGAACADVSARVQEMLSLVRLPDIGARRPHELSAGQQQRVSLARALVLRPRVLLLDEPLANLDTQLRSGMRDLIRSLQRQLGLTTLFVTHDQEEAMAIADRVALMLDGRLRQVDRPEDLYRRPADQQVAAFFGAANLIPGLSDGAVFHCALGALRLPAGTLHGTATLTIRPESVCLGPGENTFQATIKARSFLGTRTQLLLGTAGADLQAALPPDQAGSLSPGDIVTIHVPVDSLWVIP
jgi:ABC-type Fe3+/spermidine/putrescine transport system ATPase subunit